MEILKKMRMGKEDLKMKKQPEAASMQT